MVGMQNFNSPLKLPCTTSHFLDACVFRARFVVLSMQACWDFENSKIWFVFTEGEVLLHTKNSEQELGWCTLPCRTLVSRQPEVPIPCHTPFVIHAIIQIGIIVPEATSIDFIGPLRINNCFLGFVPWILVTIKRSIDFATLINRNYLLSLCPLQ